MIAIPGDSSGALMIDGGLAANADALLAAVRKVTGASRINTLINTHWHPEQVGANEAVGRNGGVIFAHEKTRMYLSNAVYSVTFEGRRPPLPEAARPTKTTREDGSLEFAGQKIDYGYMPAAHTDGDLYVHVPKLNLLVVGGVVSGEGWPLLDYRNGAWLGGRYIQALLFGVPPHDLISLAGSATVFFLTGLLAAWLPYRRAVGIDPVQTLTAE